MSLSRRGFLGAMGLTAIGAASVGAVVFPSGGTAELLRSRAPLPEPFRVPLPIPAVIEGDGEIVQRVADLEILPGLRTPLLTYGGTFPGPTIVSRRGKRTVVTHRNELPVPTAVHLHGGHVPADQDGYPTDLLLPAGWDHHGAHGGAVTR
ncbi:multicopper oxidase domain-containing protein [Actinokineospora sp. HUAS TT18]|uniref:multicopper oxidase domain-containing protein n=1 Tax=Actinokineospora sp. HUAS TT18 TaxID=3447451 RepID=UPI003F523B05